MFKRFLLALFGYFIIYIMGHAYGAGMNQDMVQTVMYFIALGYGLSIHHYIVGKKS